MARVPLVSNTSVSLAPLAGQRQQAFDNGAGAIGQGAAQIGRGVAELGRGIEIRNQKIDEAAVTQLDAGFAQAVREIESGFLATNGAGALEQSKSAEEAWAKTRDNFLGKTANDRQKALLSASLNRRQERWAGQFDNHVEKQTDVWYDETEKARIAQFSVDFVNAPVGSELRQAAADDLATVIGARVGRLGLGAEAGSVMVMEAFSDAHISTLNNMVAAGDALGAMEYLKENSAEIMPNRRAEIQGHVESAERDFQAYSFRNSGDFVVDPESSAEVDVEGDDGRMTKTTEVAVQPVGNARVSSGFGMRDRPGGVGSANHRAFDYAVPVNSPVKAMLSGTVRIKDDPNGYGTYVVIDHGDGLESLYAHLNETNVRDGQRVSVGQTIALSGGARGARGAGNSQGPHLHFEVRRNGEKVNPNTAFGSEVTTTAGTQRGLPGLPTTPDDARAAARAYAAAQGRGNDWRLIQRLEQEGLAQLSQDRSAKAVREAEAWDAIQTYLPDGSTATTSADAVPKAVWDGLSESQKRTARGMYDAAARGDGEGGASSVRLVQDLLDLSTGDARDQAEFLSYDLDDALANGYISRSNYTTLRAAQRQLRVELGEGPKPRTSANALQNMGTLVNQYARTMGIYPSGIDARPQEKQREYNDFRVYMTDQVLAWQRRNPDKELDEAAFITMANQAARRVTFRDGDSTEEGRAYQNRGGGNMRERIPTRTYNEIKAQLRGSLGRDPTDQEVSNAYYRGIGAGLYDFNAR